MMILSYYTCNIGFDMISRQQRERLFFFKLLFFAAGEQVATTVVVVLLHIRNHGQVPSTGIHS